MTTAIQDALPHNHCYGCGTLNPRGLHIKSYPDGDEVVCRFQPWPDHMAGPEHVVYGGLIASVIDCHSVCTAVAAAYRDAGRELGSEPNLWCVTASLKIDFVAPAPIDGVLELRARVVETRGRKRTVACSLRAGDRECARAEVLAIEVAGSWGRATPPAP